MKRNWKLLFSNHDLSAVLDARLRTVNDAVRGIEKNYFETSTDDYLAASTASQLVVSPLELLEEETSVSSRDVKVDVSGDRNRHFFTPGPHYMNGLEVTYHVPYLGDSTLLECQPNRFTLNPPRAVIGSGEIMFPYDRVDGDVASTKADFERDIAKIRRWLERVNEQVMGYNASLEAQASQLVRKRRDEIAKTKTALADLGYPVRKDALPGERTTQTNAATIAKRKQKRKDANREYDVALSFAGEDREYVDEVAKILDRTQVSVFYDQFEEVKLWGKDLAEHLHQVYSKDSHFVIMFASRHYEKKAWPSHERQSALSRHLKGETGRILPVKLDDTEIPGVPSTIRYIDARAVAPERLSELIRQKLDDELV